MVASNFPNKNRFWLLIAAELNFLTPVSSSRSVNTAPCSGSIEALALQKRAKLLGKVSRRTSQNESLSSRNSSESSSSVPFSFEAASEGRVGTPVQFSLLLTIHGDVSNLS